MAGKKRSIGKYLAAVATVAGALAIIPATRDFVEIVAGGIGNWGTAQLANSYPHEKWRAAEPADFKWLEDEWCYPSLGGFRATLKMSGNGLQQQNRMGPADPDPTSWVNADVYTSDTGLLRLAYRDSAWPDSFIQLLDSNYGAYYSNSRHTADDGSVISDTKVQAISCTRCTVGDTSINCVAPG